MKNLKQAIFLGGLVIFICAACCAGKDDDSTSEQDSARSVWRGYVRPDYMTVSATFEDMINYAAERKAYEAFNANPELQVVTHLLCVVSGPSAIKYRTPLKAILDNKYEKMTVSEAIDCIREKLWAQSIDADLNMVLSLYLSGGASQFEQLFGPYPPLALIFMDVERGMLRYADEHTHGVQCALLSWCQEKGVEGAQDLLDKNTKLFASLKQLKSKFEAAALSRDEGINELQEKYEKEIKHAMAGVFEGDEEPNDAMQKELVRFEEELMGLIKLEELYEIIRTNDLADERDVVEAFNTDIKEWTRSTIEDQKQCFVAVWSFYFDEMRRQEFTRFQHVYSAFEEAVVKFRNDFETVVMTDHAFKEEGLKRTDAFERFTKTFEADVRGFWREQFRQYYVKFEDAAWAQLMEDVEKNTDDKPRMKARIEEELKKKRGMLEGDVSLYITGVIQQKLDAFNQRTRYRTISHMLWCDLTEGDMFVVTEREFNAFKQTFRLLQIDVALRELYELGLIRNPENRGNIEAKILELYVSAYNKATGEAPQDMKRSQQLIVNELYRRYLVWKGAEQFFSKPEAQVYRRVLFETDFKEFIDASNTAAPKYKEKDELIKLLYARFTGALAGMPLFSS